MSEKLIIKNISKRFGDVQVLNGIKAAVPAGKITAFIGPNGAGKTTLLHIIAGTLEPDEGSVQFKSRDIACFPSYKVARMGIGRQFQDVRVFGGLSVLDNMTVGLIPHTSQDFWYAWFRTRKLKRNMNGYEQKALHWLEHVGLMKHVKQLARELSFGQQKLLALARLFACDYSFLLLDEPTAGVSPKMIEQISSLIREIVTKQGVTVALVEHNMTVVADLAYWIHFLHEGKIAFSGARDHVLGNKNVRQMYMGL